MDTKHLEKLGVAAEKLVDKIATGLEKGVEMGAEHLPVIASQYVAYCLAVAVIGTVVWSIFFGAHAHFLRKALTVTLNDNEEKNKKEAACVISVVLGFTLVVHTIFFSMGIWSNVKTIAHAALSPVTFIAKTLAPAVVTKK